MVSPCVVDELYSVSDLHLGGAPGFQIFNQGVRLGAFIDLLAARPKDRQVALVLNGDIVDYLAEDGAAYLSPERAVEMLERIFEDPAFAPVWQALARYVKTPGRVLVLVLGNHDVELALPHVKARLLRELCGSDKAARARVVTAMDGTPFSCRVGKAQVLCTHGNEVDSWNIVDHEALDKVAEALQRGESPPPWDPNAGTQLVIDVMNRIKRRYPFVDLLKPETEIVPKMLLAIDPSMLGALKNIGAILYRKARGTVRTGYLSGSEDLDAGEGSEKLEESLRDLLLGKEWRKLTGPDGSEAQVLRQMEEDFLAGRSPRQVLAEGGEEAMLGIGQYLWDRFVKKRPPHEAMREALRDWLAGDRTYDLTTADDTYQRLDAKVDPGVDFVLAGHTHLMRAIERRAGSGFYYNSGTWIRLIRLGEEILGSEEAFAPVYKALCARSMQAIDDTPGLVLLRPTAVRIVSEPGGTVGDLVKVDLQAGDRAVLQPEPQSRFVRR